MEREGNTEQKVLVAVTGASGTIYAERLIQELMPRVSRLYIVASETALAVIPYEMKPLRSSAYSLHSLLKKNSFKGEHAKKLAVFANNDVFAPVASGSSAPDQMVVVPCSMGTLARIRTGVSQSLIERSADVVMKEGRRLILCPRETPLSILHLENMLSMAKMGVTILPPTPAFYQQPKNMDDLINFVVGKILEAMGFHHDLYPAWNKKRC
ncbi:MAG: UbiX family flavin prenyltransferase [Deltaproteobacteria bacterium]|nr:UbiX family flavin prenyltransferase [Deltaproteobacteria bacterium]